MTQTFQCRHCGLRCDTVFSTYLHIYTSHLGLNIGLTPHESLKLLSHGWWDDGFWQVVGWSMNLPTWIGRN